MDAIAAQSDVPASVLQTSWADLREALATVSSAWLAILPDGAQPSPDWASLLDPHLSEPTVGCIGGRVLELDGPTMGAGWFSDRPRIAWIDWLGGIHSRFCDIPDTPQVRSAAFLRLEGVTVPTKGVSISTLEGLERWTRFEMAACFRAHELGRSVIFDSALVVCTSSRLGYSAPEVEDTDGWEHYGRGEIEVLRNYPGRLMSAWLTAHSLLVGRRLSPGLMLWPLYATTPIRRSRWCAIVRGKLRGLVGSRS
jgi:hypothetical protein